MRFCVLGSGSKGNAIFIESSNTRVLIDCGFSAREVSSRLTSVGVHASSIAAVVITHEHTDHIKGLSVFARKIRPAVYVTKKTLYAAGLTRVIPPSRLCYFQVEKNFTIGRLHFEPFRIEHDAEEPVGFRVSDGVVTLGVVTDLGCVTDVVVDHTRNLDALILESNHDLTLLEQSSYPWPVKERIRGELGHLSNESAAALLTELACEKLKIVVGAHISENSNRPELVSESIRRGWSCGQKRGECEPMWHLADQRVPSPVFTLGDSLGAEQLSLLGSY